MSDRSRADAVYAALLERQGERWVQPRVERTRRVLELLDDPQRFAGMRGAAAADARRFDPAAALKAYDHLLGGY